MTHVSIFKMPGVYARGGKRKTQSRIAAGKMEVPGALTKNEVFNDSYRDTGELMIIPLTILVIAIEMIVMTT